MSTPFNPYWLEVGAVVPVDMATTEALVVEINRLRNEEFNRGGWPDKKQWHDLSKEECWDILVKHRTEPFSLLVAVQETLRAKNT
ncbi:hypothetical protein EBZ39_09155 [bacterium]|nr:hypothetical protein [bacterium]